MDFQVVTAILFEIPVFLPTLYAKGMIETKIKLTFWHFTYWFHYFRNFVYALLQYRMNKKGRKCLVIFIIFVILSNIEFLIPKISKVEFRQIFENAATERTQKANIIQYSNQVNYAV